MFWGYVLACILLRGCPILIFFFLLCVWFLAPLFFPQKMGGGARDPCPPPLDPRLGRLQIRRTTSIPLHLQTKYSVRIVRDRFLFKKKMWRKSPPYGARIPKLHAFVRRATRYHLPDFISLHTYTTCIYVAHSRRIIITGKNICEPIYIYMYAPIPHRPRIPRIAMNW